MPLFFVRARSEASLPIPSCVPRRSPPSHPLLGRVMPEPPASWRAAILAACGLEARTPSDASFLTPPSWPLPLTLCAALPLTIPSSEGWPRSGGVGFRRAGVPGTHPGPPGHPSREGIGDQELSRSTPPLPSWEGGHLGRHAGWKPALLKEERAARHSILCQDGPRWSVV